MKISVIVPCYNRYDYLSRCLNALITQSYDDLEIVCVDDGSTDNTNLLLKNFVKKDSRIKFFSISHGGPSRARNAGLKAACGKYIMFCDCDDMYSHEMCEKLVYAMENNNCDFAQCSIEVVYEADKFMKESDDKYYALNFEGLNNNINMLLNNTDVSLCNKIFKRDLIEKYNINFPDGLLYEDCCFIWKYFSISTSGFFIKEKLYMYYRHKGSIMNKTFAGDEKSLDHLIVADEVFNFLDKNSLLNKYEKKFYEFYKASYYFATRYCPENKHDNLYELDKQLRAKYKKYLISFDDNKKPSQNNNLIDKLRLKIKNNKYVKA